MKYKDNIDYLFASAVYLGTHTYWWARTPEAMARELQLDEDRLEQVFNSFPGVFRKSRRKSPRNDQHFYSLQARYAQAEGGDTKDLEQRDSIAPLTSEKLKVVIDFILKMAEQESKDDDQAQTRRFAFRTNIVSVSAAVIAAVAAITAATIKATPAPSVQSSPAAATLPAATPR